MTRRLFFPKIFSLCVIGFGLPILPLHGRVNLKIKTNKPPSAMRYGLLAELEEKMISDGQIHNKTFHDSGAWFVWEYSFKNHNAYLTWEKYRSSTFESKVTDKNYVFHKELS